MPRSVHNSDVELAKPLFHRKRRRSDTVISSSVGLQPFFNVGRRYSADSAWGFSTLFSDRFERRGLVYVGTNEKISCSIPKTNGDGISDSKTIFLPENYQTAIQLDDADLSDLTDATVSHRYLWTPGQQDKLLADVTPTETLWTLTDHLGTIRDIVKNTPSGLVVPAHIIYDAYGNVLSCKDPNGTDIESPILFGFTGKYFDADTQLQNNVNRWYDATTGRWLSTDPIGFEGNDTNLYRYAGNKIPQMLDTWGLFNIETLLCTIKKERPALYENVRSNKVKIYTVDNFLRKYLIKSDKTQKIEIRDSSETKALFDSTKNSIYIRKEKNGAILTDCEVIKYLTHEIIHAYDFHQRKDIWKDKSVREIRAYVGSYVLYHYLQTGQLLTKKDKEIQDYLMQIKNMLNSREAYSAKELNDGFVQEYAGEVIINETVIWDWTKEPDCNSNGSLTKSMGKFWFRQFPKGME